MTTAATQMPVISYETAVALVAGAMAHARQQSWAVSVAVLDPWGAVVASGRMDGVSPTILEIATDKAFTATLGKSTKAFYERMASSPDLALGLQTRPRLCAWEGGLPIYSEGRMIGSIGVSGAEGHEDVACGEAALGAQGLAS